MRHKCSDWTYERVYGCEMCYRVANEMERIRKENKRKYKKQYHCGLCMCWPHCLGSCDCYCCM